MKLIIDYPWYFMLLCLLLGVAYAAALYLLRRRKQEPPFGRGLTALLFALRTLSVAAIAFLFLSPLVRRENNRKERPIVILAEDNSKSPDYSPDSAYYHGDFQQSLQRLADALAGDYEVVRYRYGTEVTSADEAEGQPLFGEKSTDMAQLLQTIGERYYHRNVGALVMTGDGIYNKGMNPLNAASSLTFPVYTVAMGDTTQRRDASVAGVRTNRIAYLGNNFPMEVTVNANRLGGEHSLLTVSRDGRKLFSKQIVFDNNRFSTTESLVLDADRAGLHNYVVEIAPLSGEQTTHNNRRVVPVEVIDGHQKIAIIYGSPHPDVGALRRAVEQNQNYEVETFAARDFKGAVKDYDLLILHQLPSKVAESNIDVAALLKEGTPALFVLGGQSDLARLNALHVGLEVHARIDRTNEVGALTNSDFTFFTLTDDTRQQLEHFPPLLSPFGDYRLGGNAQKLVTAKLGAVNSGMPLVAVAQQGERRYAFVAGEGLWRWRLSDYQNNQSFAHFDELVDKLVVFTSMRVNKNRFHVTVPHVVSETEPVTMEAQLYNDNYEMVNTPDVELTLRRQSNGADDNPEGAKRYLFNRTAGGYSLNLGLLPPGSYQYSATTLFNGKRYDANGTFLVENLHLEALQLVADHSLLSTLSDATGGAMVEAHDVERIAQMLKERDDLKTVIYSETRYSDMLNLPWIFVLLMLLLAAEWVIRKYNGEL